MSESALKIHHTVRGAGEPTVVLTHGIAASSNTWRFQVEALEKICRAVVWDLRGHGESDSPPGPYAIADLARDMLQVADEIGADQIVPLGHSAGGAISLRFALDHPDRTRALVLVGTASEANQKSRDFYHKLAAIAEEHGMEKVVKQLGLSREAENLLAADPKGFAHVTRAMAGLNENPMTDRIHEIRCPTLIIVGEKDFLGAGGSVIMSRKIPNSQLEIVPERGHGLFLEDPEGFNQRVLAFLEKLR
jgi:pimeloyl-ACP methyl ester carboxylesterase